MAVLPDPSHYRPWRAQMIWSEARGGFGFERRIFRLRFRLDHVPDSVIARVTADSRYHLKCNHNTVARGPLKGTLRHYHSERVQLARFLRVGDNELTADVVHFGNEPPLSEEHSGFAGFAFEGELPGFEWLDTPGQWQVWPHKPTTLDQTRYTGNAHLFLSGTEITDLTRFPREGAADWQAPVISAPLNGHGGDPDCGLIWTFRPRDVVPMEEIDREFVGAFVPSGDQTMAQGVHVGYRPTTWPHEWHVEPGQAGEIVLDAGELTTGYPILAMSGAEGRVLRITYAEGAFQPGPKPDDGTPLLYGGAGRIHKGRRDALDTGLIHGYQDTIHLGPDGEWMPFHWRTFRYIKVEVSAGPQAFRLNQALYRFTAYPLRQTARLFADRDDWDQFTEICFRSLRLCTHETYEDCPGYEQLNYLLDARNEALTTLYLTGDLAMPRRTIRLFRDTLRPDGMLSSRTPSQLRQTIPIFALWWIVMLHDLWEFAGDEVREDVRDSLIAVDGVLAYFRNYLRPDGFMGKLPYWNPIGGVEAPGSALEAAIEAGGSTYATLLMLLALRQGRRLHREVGHSEDDARWGSTEERLVRAAASVWDEGQGVFLESPDGLEGILTVHTQAMAVQSGLASPVQSARIVENLRAKPDWSPMLRQQGLPLSEAMALAGGYDVAYRQFMEEFQELRDLGLTTTLEGWADRRSDCHAWSAFPPAEFLRSLLGIRPAAPGFRAVAVRPMYLEGRYSGTLMTPKGEISVEAERRGAKWRIQVDAPMGVPTQITRGDGSVVSTSGAYVAEG
ncbi:MAG: alpha-L-rhamnosidase C-terminal domain-containing protein [Fimbriimonadaceae bacterium]